MSAYKTLSVNKCESPSGSNVVIYKCSEKAEDMREKRLIIHFEYSISQLIQFYQGKETVKLSPV